MAKGIDKLIVNSPYREPEHYWQYDRETKQFDLQGGRRPAGYLTATPKFKGHDDPGRFIEAELVNRIRIRVREWRQAEYPGVTGITKRLLEHWTGIREKDGRRFFFCQLEAIETLIWWVEAPASDKVGIDIPNDGGPFERLCSKMATGSGKTVVMAMIIAWNFLNKTTYPNDTRFSKNALIVAPGLTVKSRLKVLQISDPDNYYDAFDIVPSSLREKLRQGKVLIHNWHALAWDSQDKLDAKIRKRHLRSVDRRKHTEISLTAYARMVLQDLASAKNILVINDEAHHAWRVNPEAKGKYIRTGSDRDSAEEATVWVGGLDRIQESVGILRCFDLSATPFSPSGRRMAEETLFPWIVSDFGLTDAIESGLVKTPRVAVRDDSISTEDRSRLYHIYANETVKDNLNRKAEESERLPDLVINAYVLLGLDWSEVKKAWQEQGHEVPPVMITVANRVETSARIRYAFAHQQIHSEGGLSDDEGILQIDSKVLERAEIESEEPSRKDHAEHLRQLVDTVGEKGKPGEKIQNVISVGMLSEGWDAKTVTHIMGLRAFSSQLLCEQVVGRGLRRVSYEVGEDGLLEAEYVNIFGVPFTFLPHESGNGPPPPPPPPKTRIEPVYEKVEHEISWPNIIRIDRAYKTGLSLDIDNLQPLDIDLTECITEAELEAIIAGKPHAVDGVTFGIEEIARDTRLQTVIFRIASSLVTPELLSAWEMDKRIAMARLVNLVEQFIGSGKVKVKTNMPSSNDEVAEKIGMILNMTKIVNHFLSEIRRESTQRLILVFDTEKPIGSTAQMIPWYTGRRCEWAKKSHINYSVFDSSWESHAQREMEKSDLVHSFAKNDHLDFFVLYACEGNVRKYFPDFIVRLADGTHLILEIKGEAGPEVNAKKAALNEWVEAVNQDGRFGWWHHAISFDPSDIGETIAALMTSPPTDGSLPSRNA